jgi:transcription initiation factor TFIID subunit 5
LNLVAEGYPEESRRFYEANSEMFETEHGDDLRQLKLVTLPEHLQESEIAKKYRSAKWTMTMSTAVFHSLIQFLEAKSKHAGGTILAIINNNMDMKTVDRAASDRFSFEAMMERAANSEQELPAEDEGLPGHTSGAAPTFPSSQFTDLPKLKLGPAPMDQEKIDDVRVDLVMEDSENPPLPGQETYQKHYERMIKVEDDDFLESPQLHDVPYPKATSRDVSLEVMKVKENRDRFRIDGRNGGIGTGVSVMMMTLHNTYDRYKLSIPSYQDSL